MKKAMMMLTAVAAVTTLSAAETEVIWPSGNVKVVAGNCAKVETKGDVVYVTSTESRPNVWPAAYFTFPAPRDFSNIAEVRVTFTNCCNETLRLSTKVKADTEQGQLPQGGTSVQPHKESTHRLRLFIDNWVFDAPHGLVGLKRNPFVRKGSSFSLAKTHSVSVFLPAGSCGETFGVSRVELVPSERDAAAPERKVLHAATFSPWVDAFGQANYVEWPDKVHSVEELRAKGEAEEKDLAAHPQAIPDADRFGGWAKGPQLKATGHFRTEKVDGKWWLVDPDGHLFFSQGVDHVGNGSSTPIRGREHYFEKLPPETGPAKSFWGKMTRPALRYFYSDPTNIPSKTFDFGNYNLYLKYGDDWRAKRTAAIHRRMRSWGLNTIAASSPTVARAGESRMPYTVWMHVRSRPIATVKAHWGALLDPFAPEFEESARKTAEGLKAYKDDPFCIGFFSGNEQSWSPSETGLARNILDAPDDQPAKMEFLRRLATKGIDPKNVPDDELRAFGIAVAEKYYSTVRDAARAVAPDMLYLGDRLAWGCPDVVRAAAKYADVVTMNIYDFQPTRDLPPGSEDKPIMITEFHFGCYDTGYFYASLIPVKDQTARAAAYRNYVRAALDNPRYVGTHWFCWRDCPITGFCGEGANAQCGLVSMADVPYAELIGAIRTIAAELYPRRKYGSCAAIAQEPRQDRLARVSAVADGVVCSVTNVATLGTSGVVRVDFVLRAEPESDIRCRIELPPPERWDGRLWGVGNSSLGGSIPSIRAFAEAGTAAVTTDIGTWAMVAGKRDIETWPVAVRRDYSWRSTHMMTVYGKRMVEAYYGKAPCKSYFRGGSCGGRQAFSEAIRYPADYDGIIANLPANNVVANRFNAWLAYHSTHDKNGNLVFTEKEMHVVADAAVEYRASSDPKFYAGHFLADGRATPEEVDAILDLAAKKMPSLSEGDKLARLKALYTPFCVDGKCLTPGFAVGTYLGQRMKRKSAKHWQSVMEFAKQDGDWYNANTADLSPFFARGGRLIVIAGWEDQTISPLPIIEHYERICAFEGGLEKALEHCRLFCAPGVAHGGGKGRATQAGVGKACAAYGRSAIVRWVEEGVAPDRLMVEDKPRNTQFPVATYPGLFVQEPDGTWKRTERPRSKPSLAPITFACDRTPQGPVPE